VLYLLQPPSSKVGFIGGDVEMNGGSSDSFASSASSLISADGDDGIM